MRVQDCFSSYEDFFKAICNITIARSMKGYSLKILCQKGRYHVLIYEDGWVEDDFEVITAGFKKYSAYAWTVNLTINSMVSL